MLAVVLHCLAVQTFTDFEVIVADNGESQLLNRELIESLDYRFKHRNTKAVGFKDCYSAAEWVVEKECRGDFVCFPSDDSYYVPCFAQDMLEAAESNKWDLVYCNMLYDARFNGHYYAPIDVAPVLNRIDKTGFILRRSWFEGFPGKVAEGPCKADGELIESLVERGISHGKVPGFLMVHN